MQSQAAAVNIMEPREIIMDLREHIINSIDEKQKEMAYKLSHICPMCFSIMENPRETVCGHVGCAACIGSYFAVSHKNNSIPCWTCRGVLFPSSIGPALVLERQINAVYAISCRTCKKEMCMSDAKNHFRSECPATLFQCSCDNAWRERASHVTHMQEHANVFVQDSVMQNLEHDEYNTNWQIRKACHFASMGDEKKTESILLDLVKNDKSAEAYVLLGNLYEKGSAVIPKNVESALELYNIAVQKGSVRAMYYAARAYFSGTGCKKDVSRALDLLFGCAWQGHSLAQYSVGVLYFKGEYVPKNVDTAIDYWELSAKKYTLPSINQLLNCHSKSLGRFANISKELRNPQIKNLMSQKRIIDDINSSRNNHQRNGSQQSNS